MLIRSQNRELLINVNKTPAMGAFETKKRDIKILWSTADETLAIGSYSTKEKALKVLDMVQEAYAEHETLLQMFTGIASARLTPAEWEGTEEMKKEIQEKAIFQMPEDSEVET